MKKREAGNSATTREMFSNIPVKHSARRRSFGIKMLPDGSCTLLAPLKATAAEVAKAQEYFTPWIIRQRQKLAQQPQERQAWEFAFAIGSSFFYCGKLFELKLLPASTSQIISFRNDALWCSSNDASEIKARLENFYRRQTRRLVTGLVEKYAKKFDISTGDITINGARRRFGSCSSNGDLNFSWHLAMYPMEQIELVVLHELAHRSEMNHSSRFYRVLASYLPDHQERNRVLKLWSMKLALYPA